MNRNSKQQRNNMKGKSVQFFQDSEGNKIPVEEILGMDGMSFDSSDKSLIEKGYATSTDVQPVINKIAQTASSVSWDVYAKDKDGWVIDTNSDLNELIQKPNKHDTWQSFNYKAFINFLSSGDAFIYGVSPLGFPDDYYAELDVLSSQAVEIKVTKSYDLVNYVYDVGNYKKTYNPEEIVHIKNYDPRLIGIKTLRGLSPLEAAVYAYTASNHNWEAAANLLKNKGVIGFVSNDSDMPLTENERKSAQSVFDKLIGFAKNFGKARVLSTKMSYHPMAMNATDLKIIEMNIMNLRGICNVFNVPSSLFNDPANQSYNNKKEANKDLWTGANIPLLNRFAQHYNNTFVKAYGEREGKEYKIKPNLSKVEALQEDEKEKAERGKTITEAISNVLKLVSTGKITKEGAIILISKSFSMEEDEVSKFF